MATVMRTSARPIPRILPDLHQSHHHLVVSSSPPPWRSPAGPRARARPFRTTCYGRSDRASPTLRSTCYLVRTVPAPSKLQRRAALALSARVRWLLLQGRQGRISAQTRPAPRLTPSVFPQPLLSHRVNDVPYSNCSRSGVEVSSVCAPVRCRVSK